MKHLLFSLLFALVLVMQNAAECPVHGKSGAYFDGKTKSVDGVLMYHYKCPRGDDFWQRAR